MARVLVLLCVGLLVTGCDNCDPGDPASDGGDSHADGGSLPQDAGSTSDAGDGPDAGDGGSAVDAGDLVDAGDPGDAGGGSDSGVADDSGVLWDDAGVANDASTANDAGVATDAGVAADAGVANDAGVTNDAGVANDSGVPPTDAGANGGVDAGAGAGPCVSGAVGTHALRFQWTGTTSGSTAWVIYEANTLPDTSRWHVSAASQSIGYTPVFRDPYLAEGGLELSGTVFIDVELSTLGLSSLQNVTLAVYGRSYNTTASGSFNWQTFSGTGAAPSGSVSNSAPYEWYAADATDALPAGDDGTLLRLKAGPPSGALIVRRVELCFNAG